MSADNLIELAGSIKDSAKIALVKQVILYVNDVESQHIPVEKYKGIEVFKHNCNEDGWTGYSCKTKEGILHGHQYLKNSTKYCEEYATYVLGERVYCKEFHFGSIINEIITEANGEEKHVYYVNNKQMYTEYTIFGRVIKISAVNISGTQHIQYKRKDVQKKEIITIRGTFDIGLINKLVLYCKLNIMMCNVQPDPDVSDYTYEGTIIGTLNQDNFNIAHDRAAVIKIIKEM